MGFVHVESVDTVVKRRGGVFVDVREEVEPGDVDGVLEDDSLVEAPVGRDCCGAIFYLDFSVFFGEDFGLFKDHCEDFFD